MNLERWNRQIEFILEADREKQIERQTHICGYSRREGDAEHAWHMALMAWLLQEYSNEPIDLAKTMVMILIHDLVEIDAGDTYAYDEAANRTKEEREKKAAERIFGLLPEDQKEKLKGLWEEFEACETPEAKFAHTMDNFQPMLLNDYNEGKDWTSHQVRVSQVLKRNEHTGAGSLEIWEYMKQLLEKNVSDGKLIDDRQKEE